MSFWCMVLAIITARVLVAVTYILWSFFVIWIDNKRDELIEKKAKETEFKERISL